MGVMTMSNKDDPFKGLDKWLEQFLDDPFTSMTDEYTFHVELFETYEAYIIEADLPGYHPKQIAIKHSEDSIVIQAYTNEKPSEKQSIRKRSIILPFLLHDKIIHAVYDQDVLVITIKKEGKIDRNSSDIIIS